MSLTISAVEEGFKLPGLVKSRICKKPGVPEAAGVPVGEGEDVIPSSSELKALSTGAGEALLLLFCVQAISAKLTKKAGDTLFSFIPNNPP
jgi:hypothetical protein